MDERPFWKRKTLAEMSAPEWESLCDGCGLCCLNKLEDWDSGDIYFTSVACKLMDGESCRCTSYPNRWDFVPDCVQLTVENVDEIAWLPPTCGYRLVNEGRDLYWWHPLVSGDPETVHQAGISARGRSISETEVALDDFEDYVVDWPLTVGTQEDDEGQEEPVADEDPVTQPDDGAPAEGTAPGQGAIVRGKRSRDR